MSKTSPTKLAAQHGFRCYGVSWFTKFTKNERDRIVKAYVAGLRSGRSK